MRRILAALAATLLALSAPAAAWAKPHGYNVVHRAYAGESGYYTAASGHRVHRPVGGSNRPSGATARCRDGSWSFSESHRGTCSWHGGVASWL